MRGKSPALIIVPFQTVLFELLVERVAIDAQPRRGFDLHVIAALHHLGDDLPLDVVDDFAVQIDRRISPHR